MSEPILLKVDSVPPVHLQIGVTSPIHLQAVQNGIAVGPKGDSAYEIWLAEGNVGTEQDFLDSLKGEQGDPGPVWYVTYGDKSSALDAGTYGQVSLGDDYVYFCTYSGIAGEAVWKKSPLFKST